MIKKPVLDAMNEQVMYEMHSAYIYLSMAAYFEAQNLSGFAHWMRKQFNEEQAHALKFFDYILERGEEVKLLPLAAVPTEFKSAEDVFTQTLAHEQKVTALITAIYEKAVAANDVASQIFLQWFISEQVEEEANASKILDMLKKVGGNMGALYQLDHALGKRG